MKINNLSFKYYQKATNNIIENLNFSIPENKITVITGKSGCGKSTLAYILAGLYPRNCGIITSGEVIIDEQNINEIAPNEKVKLVTMMFQNPSMQFCMQTLREELIFSLENLGLSSKEIDLRIEKSTEIVGTTNLLDTKFNILSGGEKQKCSLTCIVALESKYVILDEPFANIDFNSTIKLIKTIKKLQETYKTTFVVIDHKISVWEDYLDDLFCMNSASEIVKIDKLDSNSSEIKKVTPLENIQINISNFNINYGNKPILNNVNLAIKQGSIVSIVGESGCGKTTFLKAFYGKIKFEGEIIIDDIKVCKKNYKKLCKTLGIVLQNPMNQFTTQQVLSEVEFNCKEDTINQLKEFDLFKYQKYSPYMLSQGQQRRLAVLCVVGRSQKVLLLDEPTYGQDDFATKKIMNILLQKVINEKITVIMSTHDMELAYQYSNNIFEIKKGEINEIYR